MEKEIIEAIEKNKDKIYDDLYPASEGCRILVREYGFDEKEARRVFLEYTSKLGFICNPDNF